MIDRAKEVFGTTNDVREAFYILPDGTMLDGSGRHWGGREVDVAGQRQVDHGDIGEVIDDSRGGAEAMYKWMARSGAMRFDQIVGIASVAQKPTPQQLAVLNRASRGKYLALSRNTPEGRIVDDIEFDSATPSKIRKFFADAQVKADNGVAGAFAQKSQDQVRGSFSPERNTIRLTPNADKTTFCHEWGHWYLTTLMSMGTENRESPELSRDVQTILDFFGVKDVDAWNALSFEEQERHQEKFAYSFEKYLAEGKVPSSAMKSIFNRLAKMIRAAYRKVVFSDPADAIDSIFREQFNEDLPPLSDEMRRIFDRMFVSEQLIENRKMAEGLTPLFAQKPKDMSEETWRELVRAQDDADIEAENLLYEAQAKDERWYTQARQRELAKVEAEAQRVRRETKKKVSLRINSMKEVQAYDILRTGGRSHGWGNLRIDRESVAALGYSEEQIAALEAAHIFKNGGYPVSAARELIKPFAKFNSDRQMIDGVLSAIHKEVVIDRETERELLEKHSDLYDSKKRDALVTKALFNEARGRVLATELKLITGDTRTPVRVLREAARLAAVDMVNRMPAKRVSVKSFIGGAKRASQAVLRAIQSGDMNAVAAAKRSQMVQFEAATYALEIEDKMRRLKEIRKRAFRADKEVTKTRDIAGVSAARFVLTSVGLGRGMIEGQTNKEQAMRLISAIKDYSPEKYSALAALVDEFSKRPDADFMEMSTEDALSVAETVIGLWQGAREAKVIEVEGKSEHMEDVVNRLMTQDNERKLGEFKPGANEAVTDKERGVFNFMSVAATLKRVEHWCVFMDGGTPGVWHRYIFEPVAKGAARYRNANNALQKKLSDLYRASSVTRSILESIAANTSSLTEIISS